MPNNWKKEVLRILEHKLTKTEIDELILFLKQSMSCSMCLEDDRFFKDLTYQVRGQVKELARILLDFRKNLKSRLHPGLTDIATKFIPQTADQLEGIIETTEIAAQKIMDNLEKMQDDIAALNALLSSIKSGNVKVGSNGNEKEIHLDGQMVKKLLPLIENAENASRAHLALIADSFVQMSFQDLTGQRIRRIIGLVGQIEEKVKEMVLSFGIQLSEKEKNPDISREDLLKAVKEKVSQLTGPQRSGKGLDQSDIDYLLANL